MDLLGSVSAKSLPSNLINVFWGAMGIEVNKKPAWFMSTDRCSYSGLPITQPEKFACSDPGSDFHADMVKLGDSIFLVKAYGYVSSFAESEFLAFCDKYISIHFEIEKGIIYIEDYASLKGGDSESRKKYVSYLSGNDFFIAAIFYNLSPIYKLSVSLAQKLHLYGSRAHAVHTYEQAIDLALKLFNRSSTTPSPDCAVPLFAANLGNGSADKSVHTSLTGFFHQLLARFKNHLFFFTEKAKRQLSEQYSEKLIQYIASIDWQKPGIPLPENILYDDFASKKVFDAISFVKSEIDSLMEERAAAEAVLRESEAKYRLLVQHAKAGILEYDYNTNRILAVNDELVKFSGYSEEELLSINPIDLFTEESQKIFSERLRRILSGEPISQDIIYQSATKNNDIRWWLLNADVKYQNGRPDKANVVITDITPFKQAENNLLEYQEKLKRLGIRLSMVEEDHRRSMASHLHETIGQELFVMQLQLAAFEKTIDNPLFLKPLKQIKDQLLKIIKETKALTFDLSPPVLYDLGFQEALKTLSGTIASKHNIHVQTSFEGEMDVIEDEIKVILYRNFKELMHNTVKHAGANNIQIHLKNVKRRLHAEFRDDGIGFDAANYNIGVSSLDGYGLFDIREKLNHLGGQLTIDSMSGKGTVIRMEVPLDMQ